MDVDWLMLLAPGVLAGIVVTADKLERWLDASASGLRPESTPEGGSAEGTGEDLLRAA